MSDTHDQQIEKAAKALTAYLRELHGIWRVAPTRQTALNAARVVLDAVTPQEEWKRTAAIGELREAVLALRSWDYGLSDEEEEAFMVGAQAALVLVTGEGARLVPGEAMSDTHDQQIEKATNAILARRHGPLGIFVTREMARGLARAALDAVASEDNEREAFRRGAIWGARNLVRKDDGSWLIPSDGIVDFFLDPEARG